MKISGCIAASVLGGVCALASADRVDLFVFENADSANLAGLDLWVDVINVGGSKVDFTFHNDSSIACFISAIYFENKPITAGLSNPTLFNGPGVAFSPGATPANPPGAISGFGGSRGGTFFGTDANAPSPFHGISPGEWLTVRFDLSLGLTHATLVSALTAGDWRIAQHVQGIDNGKSIWTTTPSEPLTVVPLPPAAWAGLSGLAFVAAVKVLRRRSGR